MSQTVVLKVGMSCQGCVGAVKRVLGKMEGVESYDINLEEQKVTVSGNVQPEAVLQTVSKTGKKTSFWEEEAAPAVAETKPVEAETQATEAETKPTDAETKPEDAETKPADAETKPEDAETKPTDTETKPTDAKTKPEDATAAP